MIQEPIEELAFVARPMVQVFMPRSEPKSNEICRKINDLQMTMISPSKIGLPYGSIPRLLLSLIVTEAIKKKSRHVYLGATMTECLRKLEIPVTGGNQGGVTRFKRQLYKLVQTSFILEQFSQEKTTLNRIDCITSTVIYKGNKADWAPEIVLNQDFYDQVIQRPVPIDFSSVKALKRSSMAIDLYCWLSYRIFSMKSNRLKVSWDNLFEQFGFDYGRTSQGFNKFKKDFCKHMSDVLSVYPANVSQENGVVLVK